MPLRGKVLNTEKCTLADIEKNEELNTLIYTLGAGVGPDAKVASRETENVGSQLGADGKLTVILLVLLVSLALVVLVVFLQWAVKLDNLV